MNKFIKYILIASFCAMFFVFMFAPSQADAALVHCGREGTPECTKCDLLVLADNIIDFVIGTVTPAVATLLFIYAGFLIMLGTGKVVEGKGVGSIYKGKEVFTTTVIGIVIIFGAWLAVNFLLQTLAGDSNISGSWHEIECVDNEGATSGAAPAPYSGGAFNDALAPETSAFLDCMRRNLPVGVGRPSSTTDMNIARGLCSPLDPNESFNDPSNCQHRRGSCHYGGTNPECQARGSYAIDFGDEENFDAIRNAAKSCNSGAFVNYEGDHVHVSIGNSYGCGCN